MEPVQSDASAGVAAGADAGLTAGYDLGGFFDEMFESPGRPRPHYRQLYESLAGLMPATLEERSRVASSFFLTQGIGFTVYGDEQGTERIFPFDLVPRIVPADEWAPIERGLDAADRALNLFLNDVYHDQQILADGRRSRPSWSSARGTSAARWSASTCPRGDLHARRRHRPDPRRATAATSCSRTTAARPSGVSYMLENRQVAEAGLPAALRAVRRPRRSSDYPRALLDAALGRRRAGSDDPTVVLLTPGHRTTRRTSSTPSWPGRWAIELVEGSDLFVDDNRVFMRTTRGLERVDVIYRRIDDDFLDPLAFRARPLLGVPGLRQRLSRRQRHARQRDRHRRRRRQGDLPVRPGHDPLLPGRGADARERADVPRAATTPTARYILEHLDELVVKAVNESRRLRHADRARTSTAAERERVRRADRGRTRATTSPSRRSRSAAHPTFVDGELRGRARRPAAVRALGDEVACVVPGGLTRVALRPGSLVVNSLAGRRQQRHLGAGGAA